MGTRIIHSKEHKKYLQNEKMTKLWVFVDFCNKRRFEQIYKTSLQNETVRWIIKRSSHWEVFCQKVVLKYFTEFTEKHLWWSLFFNKVAGLRPETLLKKRLQHRCFPVSFVKFFKNTFKKNILKNPSGSCFCPKDLFLSFFCNEKSSKEIFFQLSGLTNSKLVFIWKSRVYFQKILHPFEYCLIFKVSEYLFFLKSKNTVSSYIFEFTF